MEEKEDDWHTLTSHPHFEQYMSLPRFKEFREFLPSIFMDETKIESDPWYQFSDAVEEFNEIRRKRVVGSLWISVDESMSAWKPRTTDKGGLPNISFIVRKPKRLLEQSSNPLPVQLLESCVV